MPVWHEATEDLRARNKIQMVGIIEEQHPDRARLFMQWKQMDWPLLVDSLNLLEVPAVPITLALDEHGVIRIIYPDIEKLDRIEAEFVDRTFEMPASAIASTVAVPDLEQIRGRAEQDATADAWRTYAHAVTLWGDASRLQDAIDACHSALEIAPDHDPTHFRLGVIYRKRYDSKYRQPGDFQNAVRAWTNALALAPNNYIWRRRIQQYGPRLDKPYPFYDWVPTAREEIRTRGETPTSLTAEPGGAEFAAPAEHFDTYDSPETEPDPEGRITRDASQLVEIDTIVVPPSLHPGQTARVHVLLKPNADAKAHWNNEVDNSVLWVAPPANWEVDQRYHTVANPTDPLSQEERAFEFEVYAPEDISSGEHTLGAYAVYYVCEDVHGICLYRRQDITIQLNVAE